eukprot:3942737-Ditylum_brightwellii.AAC.1
MEMRYFWLIDQVTQGNFDIHWCLGLENLGDYVTKHHAPAHHIKVHPLYLHTPTSSWFLPHVLAHSVLQGCVDPAQNWMPDKTGKGQDTSQVTSACCAITNTCHAYVYIVYTQGRRAHASHAGAVPWAIHSVSRLGT